MTSKTFDQLHGDPSGAGKFNVLQIISFGFYDICWVEATSVEKSNIPIIYLPINGYGIMENQMGCLTVRNEKL